MNTEPLILDEEQERDAQRIAHEPSLAALDASTMSAGKTVVALRAAKIRDARVILIVGPLQTRGGWSGTAQRGWMPTEDSPVESFADLPFHWIRNHKDGRRAAALLRFNTPGIYFVGHAYASALAWDVTGRAVIRDKNGQVKIDPKTNEPKTKVIKKYNKFWENIHPDMLIVDEVHKGAIDTTTLTWKTLENMKPGFTLGLSGTPHGNFFEGIYPVTKLLWPDYVDKNLTRFKSRWCATEYDPWGWDHMKVVGEKNPGAYFAWLPCVVRRIWEYEGEIDSDEVYVDLSAQQRKAYDELERDLVTWLNDQPFTIDFPATLRIRLRQATLGMFHQDENGSIEYDIDCKSTKLEALKGVLEKDFRGESALILTDSARFAHVTTARLNKMYGEGSAEMWSGRQSQALRDETKQRFIAGTTKYVVMVIKAGGTGTDGLQFATRNIAVLSQDDSRIENEQVLARGIRRGQGDLVRLRYIIANDTYDQGILHGQLAAEYAMRQSMSLTPQS